MPDKISIRMLRVKYVLSAKKWTYAFGKIPICCIRKVALALFATP
jgi:hypothetical protein